MLLATRFYNTSTSYWPHSTKLKKALILLPGIAQKRHKTRKIRVKLCTERERVKNKRLPKSLDQ